MSLLVVSQEDISRYATTDDALTEARRLKPRAVLLVGITSVDTLELACRLKTQDPTNRLPVGITEYTNGLSRPELLTLLRSSVKTPRPPQETPPRRFVVDVRAREIFADSTRLVCSPTEFRLLVLFLRYPGIVFSRGELSRRICSMNGTTHARMIDVFVHRIRCKIETKGELPMHLRTIRGLGYVFQHNHDVFIDAMTRDRFLSWPCCWNASTVPVPAYGG